jgi:hypothetical protein
MSADRGEDAAKKDECAKMVCARGPGRNLQRTEFHTVKRAHFTSMLKSAHPDKGGNDEKLLACAGFKNTFFPNGNDPLLYCKGLVPQLTEDDRNGARKALKKKKQSGFSTTSKKEEKTLKEKNIRVAAKKVAQQSVAEENPESQFDWEAHFRKLSEEDKASAERAAAEAAAAKEAAKKDAEDKCIEELCKRKGGGTINLQDWAKQRNKGSCGDVLLDTLGMKCAELLPGKRGNHVVVETDDSNMPSTTLDPPPPPWEDLGQEVNKFFHLLLINIKQ